MVEYNKPPSTNSLIAIFISCIDKLCNAENKSFVLHPASLFPCELI